MTGADTIPPPEETLDPEDWESMRALGHRMLDDMLDFMRTIRERPVWQPIPDQVKTHFSDPLSLEPQAPEAVYQEFLESVLPYPIGNLHPRFWAGCSAQEQLWALWLSCWRLR